MKKLIPILLIALMITSCSKNEELTEGTGNVIIKFTNLTGFTIKNLSISNRKIGTLENNASTKQIRFENFRFDSGMPDEKCSGTIDGNQIESINQFFWCGTQKTKIDKGKYEMEIILINKGNKKYFQLKNSKK